MSGTRDMSCPRIGEEFWLECEDTYWLIVDIAEKGMWILNRGDIIVLTNKKLHAMLSYSKDELLCRTSSVGPFACARSSSPPAPSGSPRRAARYDRDKVAGVYGRIDK